MKIFINALLFLCLACNAIAQTFSEEIKNYREKYKQELLEDSRTPVKAEDLQYINFFNPNESFRVTAVFSKTENAIPFDMATMNGKVKKYVEYGSLSFSLSEKKYNLKIYQSETLKATPEYADYLFLPFTDETNGNETYGGGRYLDFKIGDIKNNTLIIDFNKAYNPYCAYSSGFSCPKPPAENNLPITLNAGEKKFAKSNH